MTVGGATEASLKDRRTLAEEGFITVVLLVDADTGELAEPPDFLAVASCTTTSPSTPSCH